MWRLGLGTAPKEYRVLTHQGYNYWTLKPCLSTQAPYQLDVVNSCGSRAVNIHITAGRLSSRLRLVLWMCYPIKKKKDKLQTTKFIHICIVSDVFNSFTSDNITRTPRLQKYISVNITTAVQFILYQFSFSPVLCKGSRAIFALHPTVLTCSPR